MNLIQMKRLATGLLIAMLALLAISAQLIGVHPVFAWLRAFAEAAAVGALADWFAVTALFRHPLGLPIPHTAIIPRSKNAIGAKLGDFVENNFLTPQMVVARVAGIDVALRAATWLRDRDHAEASARRLSAVMAAVVERIDDTDLKRVMGDWLARETRRIDFSVAASKLLVALIDEGRHQVLFDRCLVIADDWLGEHRAQIQAKVGEGSRYTPKFVDAYVSNRFIAGVLALIHEVASDPGHELRQRFDAAARDFALQLRSDEAMRERLREIVSALVDQVRYGDSLARVWAALKARLFAGAASQSSALQRRLADALVVFADGLAADRAMLDKLNEWAVQALEVTVVRHRHEVSLLIAGVVKTWDASEVSARIEAEIGRDLQFIRINGTVVGGIVGVVLHAVGG